MALIRPVHIGVEDIMEAFDNLSKTGDQVFAVWYGRDDIAFQCTIDDREVQRDMLEKNLQALARSGNTDLLHLKMYPAGVYGFIDGKSKMVSNTPIQVCEYQAPKTIAGEYSELPANRPNGMSREAWDLLHRLETMPDTIEAKINAAVEARLKEVLGEEEEEEDPVAKTMGFINGLTQNPQVMGFVSDLFKLITTRQAAPVMAPSRIGMVEQEIIQPQQEAAQRIPYDDDAMNNGLDILSYHCDLGATMSKLAAIAQNNPAYFKTLVTMLMNAQV